MLLKCCTQYASKFENSAVVTGLEKVRFHSNTKEMQCQRMLNYHTTILISHASQTMLKTLQARFQQYVNRELSNVQGGFRNGRGIRYQIVNISWIIEKARGLFLKSLLLLH